MIKNLLIVCLLILSLIDPVFAQRRRRRAPRPARDNNGCQLPFTGSDRKAVKLRRANLNYSFHNGGRAISLTDWYEFVCPLDVNVLRRRSPIPATQPMELEKLKVKVRGYIMAVKLAADDNDLHIQIAETPSPYMQQQLIVEIPPGEDYCEARTNMMELFRADGGTRISKHIFSNPPLVEVTGYLFFDASHRRRRRADYCTNDGGRGMRELGNPNGPSPVRGIWEIHPVIKLEKVS